MTRTIQLPHIIAHRGARSIAPENTLIAMREAKNLGAQWVEFDVMLTADGEAIVIHDTRLDRTTNGIGEVGETNYREIASLDAGSWFSSKYAGEKVPRFIEMLECLNELGLTPNVEIKPYSGQDKQTAITVMNIIRKHWPQKNLTPLISSFSLESLEMVRTLDKDIPIGIVCYEANFNWKKTAEKLNAVSVHVNELTLTENLIAEIKSTQRYVLSYTVNELPRAKTLFSQGVDAIFTDQLPMFSEYL